MFNPQEMFNLTHYYCIKFGKQAIIKYLRKMHKNKKKKPTLIVCLKQNLGKMTNMHIAFFFIV